MTKVCYNIWVDMDYEEKKKKQFIRVLIAEAGMVISVLVIVVVATLAAMGFFISNSGIEQSGLMQIHSLPTGATVELDGHALFSKTNLSKTMSAGEHTLKLSRENYDTWEKTIRMYSGVLIRLHYPRLFLQNRETETVMALSEKSQDKEAGLEFYQPSQSRNYIIYAEEGSAVWKLLDVKGDEVRTTLLDLSGILPGVVEEKTEVKPKTGVEAQSMTPKYRFEGEIEEIIWSRDENRVLVKVRYEGKIEWLLVNLRDIASSLNLTKTFGMSFEQIEMIDNSANQLFALENHQLRRINVSERTMSRVLLGNVAKFASNGTNVIYLTTELSQQSASDANSTGAEKYRAVGVYRNDEKDGTVLTRVKLGEKVQIALARYFDEDYMCYIVDKKPTILYGDLPSYDEKGADLSRLKTLAEGEVLDEVPESLETSWGDEYLVARTGTKYMVIGLDMGDLYEYDAPTAGLNWLDGSMMYAVRDGEVLVWDFDGTNQRNLAESVRSEKDRLAVMERPVMIASNNRWMYYLTEDKTGIELVREKIRD